MARNRPKGKKGKTARNELIKLRATYYNNVSVALFVTGFVVPYFAIVQRFSEVNAWLADFSNGTATINFTVCERIAEVIVPMLVAFYYAISWRKKADKLIGTIED